MPGSIPRFETGPKTYEAKSNIAGAQVVQYATGTPTQPGLSLVEPAAADSFKVAGVATTDAVAAVNQDALKYGTSGDGYPFVNVAVPSESVAVGKRGEWPLKYSAAANYGDPVKAGALGTVVPAAAADYAAGLVIGRCQAQAGVASGAFGDTWINVN